MNEMIRIGRNSFARDRVTRIEIAGGALAGIENARGVVLSVERGSVWVTQHHSPHDVALSAGQSFCIGNNGLTIATSTDRSVTTVLVLRRAVPVRHSIRGLSGAFGTLVARVAAATRIATARA